MDAPARRFELGATRQADGTVLFRVWAPKARQVELVLIDGEQRRYIPLAYDDDGYCQHREPDLRAGQRYAYRLNGGAERPDPCSRWQPDGVHAPSALYFPEEFAWSETNFAGVPQRELVIYELHIGTFTPEGTCEAAIERLPALKELGVTAIEIMPVAQFPGERNWGYDGVDLFAPQSSYGGPVGLQRLVDAAHRLGLAAILDVVYNHFGPEGNYTGEFGYYDSRRYNTTWGPAYNFDGRYCDPVRDFVLANVEMWIRDYRFDGLRLDAVHAMYDMSPVHILREIKETADAAAAARGGTACVIVESLMNDVRMLLPPERGGYGVDAEWNEDFHHALQAYLTGERHGKYVDFGPLDDVRHVLQETFLLSGRYSRYRGRRWGRPAGDLPGERFVIGIQNHDHVGNRAQGERLARLVPPAAQRMAASMMLLAQHVPLLFMGEEYGEEHPFLFFCSFGDADLIEGVREGRKRDYQLQGEVPDPQAESTFAASRLSWSWPEGSHGAGLRRLYRDLLRARRTWPALQNTRDRAVRLVPDAKEGPVLELVRGGTDPADPRAVWIVFNMVDQPSPFDPQLIGDRQLLFRSEAAAYCGDNAPELSPAPNVLLPYECRVYGGAELSPIEV